jgi:hypothetical protein
MNISPTSEDYMHLLSPNTSKWQEAQQNEQYQTQLFSNNPSNSQHIQILPTNTPLFQQNQPNNQPNLQYHQNVQYQQLPNQLPLVPTYQQENIPIIDELSPSSRTNGSLHFHSIQTRDTFYGNCPSMHTSNNNISKVVNAQHQSSNHGMKFNKNTSTNTKVSIQEKKNNIIPEPPFKIDTLSKEINNAMKVDGSRISQSSVVNMIESLFNLIVNSSDKQRNIKIISSLVLSIILGAFKFVKNSKENELTGRVRVTKDEIYKESIKQIFSIEESIDYTSMNFHEFINLLQGNLLQDINNQSLVSSFRSELGESELNSQTSSSSSSTNINNICHNMILTDINKVKYSNDNLLSLLTDKDIRIKELLNMNEQLRSQIHSIEIGSTNSNQRKRSNSSIVPDNRISTMKIVNINSTILQSAIPKIENSEIHFILFTMHYFVNKGIFIIPQSNMNFASFFDCIADIKGDSNASMIQEQILQFIDESMKQDEVKFIYETTHNSKDYKVKPANYDCTRDSDFVKFLRNCVEQSSIEVDMVISRLIPMISTMFDFDFILYKYEYNLHFTVLGSFVLFNESSHDFTKKKSKMIVQYKDNDKTMYRIFEAMENLLEEFDTILSKHRNFF